jgi:hypothetical protein
LIVCEGQKTEPNYLKELIREWRLSSANVLITGDGGSAPKSVVDYAIRRFKASPDYDRVYCVFDRDGHSTFDAAVQRVRQEILTRSDGEKAHFESIVSTPCFEYWIFLHFRYSAASMSNNVRRMFRGIPQLADYSKGMQDLFALTQSSLEIALANADRANRVAAEADTYNPTTQMPNLIRYLCELRRRRKNA